jgi:hypothetical protein
MHHRNDSWILLYIDTENYKYNSIALHCERLKGELLEIKLARIDTCNVNDALLVLKAK